MSKLSTKEVILHTAIEHFSKFGYESTTLEHIANKCNITKPAIYYHFKDKASLYQAVICSQFSTLAEEIEKNTETGDAVEKLNIYIVTFGEFLISHPTFNAIFAREIASGGHSLPIKCSELLSRTLARLISILDEGKEQKVFEDENPFMVQMMIVSTLTSYNTTSPLRQKVARLLKGTKRLPEPNFQNIIESLSKNIIKGLSTKGDLQC